MREGACGDRASRDARHPVEPAEEAELVQAPEGAQVEEHRPVAAAREAEGDPGLHPPAVAVPDVAHGAGRLGERGITSRGSETFGDHVALLTTG